MRLQPGHLSASGLTGQVEDPSDRNIWTRIASGQERSGGLESKTIDGRSWNGSKGFCPQPSRLLPVRFTAILGVSRIASENHVVHPATPRATAFPSLGGSVGTALGLTGGPGHCLAFCSLLAPAAGSGPRADPAPEPSGTRAQAQPDGALKP